MGAGRGSLRNYDGSREASTEELCEPLKRWVILLEHGFIMI